MMQINNVHSRIILGSYDAAKYLIDSLPEDNSPFWPTHLWPRGQWDCPLRIGAQGSHGGTRYIAEEYQPGILVKFRFTYPSSYQGFHMFIIEFHSPNSICFKHITKLSLKGMDAIVWRLAIRWVHDALIEDALDCAELYLTQTIGTRNKWRKRVYCLRYMLGCGRLIKEALCMR
jgi:hypothetical protein